MKNTATEDGGALKTAGGIATINKSTFVENVADERRRHRKQPNHT